ncbi:PucR family transcriptional regulator [Nocardioides seonyuensis]|uniref:PucR family transcriptional regulator n=1 Tax=Nocardioides seonyuensis TaxID=2518371 RepID=A0A4V1BM94_9ACTN|nr:helix-turn-helix domain-containing protein [Nocardioides seonyuensis]QBX55582.1 PucR family transcriptional regulator [Nocardioides seonyuensis]
MTGTAHTAETALHHAWGLLLGQSDTIADSITLTLFERDGDLWDRIGPEFRVDVRASTREHIRRGLRILAAHPDQGARPDHSTTTGDNAVELWRETGRRRARQGVPLELVLNAYNLGARILWEALVTKVSADPSAGVDDQVLLTAAREVWSTLDVQNTVLIDAYRRESARIQRQDLQREQAVLDSLIEGRGADPMFADEARTALQVGPDDDIACVVVVHDGTDTGDSLGPVEDRLDRLGITARWHVRSGVYYGLLSGALPSETGLVQIFEAHAPGRMGIAASLEGVAGFATAFQLAHRAAETVPRGEHRVVAVTDRLPEVLLAGSPQVAPRLLAETLGPILALPRAQAQMLLDTLAALLQHDGSPTHAAADLYCHRNTVIYRMKQIEQLTGRSLADPRDKMLLGLALMARARP